MNQASFATKLYKIFVTVLTILLFLSGVSVDIFVLYVTVFFGVPTVGLGVILLIFLFVGFAMLLVATSMLSEIRKEVPPPPIGFPIDAIRKLEEN